MTSAPKSASVCVHAGPATTRVKSTTSKPSRAVGTPFARGARSGNCGLAAMVPLLPSGIEQRDHSRCARDCKGYFEKFNVGNRLRRMRALRDPAASPDRLAPIQRIGPGPWLLHPDILITRPHDISL